MTRKWTVLLISQLDKNCKDTKETIIDNCDSLLFLGSKSSKTNE